MLLDTRSWLVLEEMISSMRLSVSSIALKFDLNSRQIDYTYKKINDFLELNELPLIEKINQDFIAQSSLLTSIHELNTQTMVPNLLFSEEERIILILIMLIGKQEEISLQHFIIDLDSSKNTVLNDLKKAKERIEDLGLQIEYSRNDGYYMSGSEFMIRKLLLQLLIEILERSNVKNYLANFLTIDEIIKEMTEKIHEFEKETNIHFTDNKLISTPYFVALILTRINSGCLIENLELFKEEIVGTREYEITERIFNEKGLLPKSEIVYLTLHLLSIDLAKSSSLLDESMPEISDAIDKIIELVEMNACISFNDRPSLKSMLMQHIKPAYYRMKYGLTLSATFSDVLKEEALTKEFKEISSMVKVSISPLEKIIGRNIPEDELSLITLIFAGWLKSQEIKRTNIQRAIVVCPQGISVSRILFLTLKELIPEVQMIASVSVREFTQMASSEYDLIFSTIFIQTDKPLFIVSSFITAENRNTIRRNVMQRVFGLEIFTPDITEIVTIISRNAEVRDEKKLRSDLSSYFYKDDKSLSSKNIIESDVKPSLFELLVPSHITIKEKVDSWEEAISLAAVPLLRHEIIRPSYIDKMIEQYQANFPYISFGESLVVPHLNFEEAVSGVGMSFLKLEQQVKIPNNLKTEIIVILATPNKSIHLKAMIQLLNLSVNESDIAQIVNSQDILEIREVLKKYQTQ